MIWNYLKRSLLVLLLLASSVHADDIDVYAGVGSASGTDVPQLMFVIDSAANFSASVSSQRCSITEAGVVKTDGSGTAATFLDGKAAAVEQCALYAALSSLSTTSTATFSVGVMGFNGSGMEQFNPSSNTLTSSCVGGSGGCLLMPLTPFTSSNKTRILEWIRCWTTSNGSRDSSCEVIHELKSNNNANGAAMQETWAYYTGRTGVSGRSYSSMAPTVGCAGRYVLFIGNAYRNNSTPGDQTNDANSPRGPLEGNSTNSAQWANPAATTKEKTIVTDTITTSCGSNTTLESGELKGVYALNWALYMKGQGFKTYSIGVLGPSCNAEYAAHLTKLGSAEIGGGKYFATSSFDELSTAIKTVLAEIQSVNSVFASASLPVSVNTQGSYLNQVFMGMFRPDGEFNPRWYGNLKQYKLGKISGSLEMLDAAGADAISATTGFITGCARSYWTPSSTDTYWADDLKGDCSAVVGSTATVAQLKASNSPDGNVVEKGGQAYTLRATTPGDRNVKTCSTAFASCTALTNFSTSNSSVTSALTSTLVDWARGLNNKNPDELNMGSTVMRPSVHGDVVHSRPVAVNYGTDALPSVVVFYGGNDGMLRAVNGNRSSSITSGSSTFTAGQELWSFMPPEFYSKIQRLNANSPPIKIAGSDISGSTLKDYGMDGPITAFQTNSSVYLYAPMRRGGRVAYAFDVTTAATPTLLWKKGCPNAANDTDCSSGFSGMGQAWTSLKTMYAQGYGAGASPLVIMGGGYDTCEDYDALTSGGKNHNCVAGLNLAGATVSGATTKGNKIYVMDAVTGALVRSFDTARSVIADVTLVLDANKKAKYGYTADMGGNVYRLSFGTGGTSTWSITKIASLGCDTPSLCTDSVANRKFGFAPSVVTADGSTYYVMLGSGEREKPVGYYAAAKSVTNYFFAIKDAPSDTTWLTSQFATCGGNFICRASLTSIPAGSTSPTTVSDKGWYLGLTSSEQVVTSALTIFGVVSFSTHQPAVYSADACTANLGTTLVYNISYLNAEPFGESRYSDVAGDGLPPSPLGGRVTLDDGSIVNFCMGCTSKGGFAPQERNASGSGRTSKSRLYWYVEK